MRKWDVGMRKSEVGSWKLECGMGADRGIGHRGAESQRTGGTSLLSEVRMRNAECGMTAGRGNHELTRRNTKRRTPKCECRSANGDVQSRGTRVESGNP